MLRLILIDAYGVRLETQFLHGKTAMFYGRKILKSNPNCTSLKLVNTLTKETVFSWR